MKKYELLSPVGNMASLYQAINNNADAVYLSLKKFGARSYAQNFSETEMVEAIKLCHLYGVRIYVTMNTLVKEKEVTEFLKQVEFLHRNKVDAIIMQDFGMICLVRELFPKLEIHASTQANNSSIDTINFFHKIGVKRVVLSRELSIEEIKQIKVPIELEIFIHGALCISYSGNCLMSSMLGNRSGNRGECTGCCRLPYYLYKDNQPLSEAKYFLSTKELNSSYNFSQLLDTNITSFKIEGRMKSPEYVGFITNLYRKLIDLVPINLDEELNKLRTIFNRKFTGGHLFSDLDLMNIETPNHIGLKIGKVVDISKKKIKIKLEKELNQEDGIRFLESNKGLICNYLYNEKDQLINSSHDFVYVDNKIDLKTYDTVYKTLDQKLIKSLQHYQEKKIFITMKLKAKINQPLQLEIQDDKYKVIVEKSLVEKAKTSSISLKRIKEQLQKVGNSPFLVKNIIVQKDDQIFISIKELNELRRLALEKLIIKRQNPNSLFEKKEVKFSLVSHDIPQSNILTAKVMNEEQLKTCLELNFSRIYVNNYELYKKYQNNSKVFYKHIRNLFLIDQTNSRNLVSEYFLFKQENNNIGNYTLNIENSYTAYYLQKYGLKEFALSVELTEEEIITLLENYQQRFGQILIPEILVYGKVENMYIKGNILNIDSFSKYQLKDFKNRYFDVYLEANNTVILNYEVKNLSKKLSFPHQKRFDFYDEDAKSIREIVKNYQ